MFSYFIYKIFIFKILFSQKKTYKMLFFLYVIHWSFTNKKNIDDDKNNNNNNIIVCTADFEKANWSTRNLKWD